MFAVFVVEEVVVVVVAIEVELIVVLIYCTAVGKIVDKTVDAENFVVVAADIVEFENSFVDNVENSNVVAENSGC